MTHRRIGCVLLLLALAGCATQPYHQPTPSVVHRVGAEIGGYPTASTLLGPERMIADQNGATVNITPSQISTFVFANGGTAGLNQLLPSQSGQNGNCLSTNGTNPLWAACGSGGGSTWPSLAGIPCYSGASSWCTSYNPSNQIPASYIPTLNQNTTGLAGGISGSPMAGQFWGYNGTAQGWYTPSGSGISGATNTIACNNTGSTGALSACTSGQTIGVLTSGTPNAQTGTTYTLVIGDANGEVTMANASANTLTIPANASVAFAVGTVITAQQLSSGATSVAPASGVTFQSAQFGSSATQNYPLGGIYGLIQLQKAATDTWNVIAYQPGPGSYSTSGTCTTPTSQTGVALAGSMAMASAGNCTIIITPHGVLPAAHGWTGPMHDRTQPTIATWGESSTSTTSITFTVPTGVANTDGIAFGPLVAY